MKYKVIDYVSDVQEEQTGHLELMFWDSDGEKRLYHGWKTKMGIKQRFFLLGGDWGDYCTIYIDNVVKFSAWLQEKRCKTDW